MNERLNVMSRTFLPSVTPYGGLTAAASLRSPLPPSLQLWRIPSSLKIGHVESIALAQSGGEGKEQQPIPAFHQLPPRSPIKSGSQWQM